MFGSSWADHLKVRQVRFDHWQQLGTIEYSACQQDAAVLQLSDKSLLGKDVPELELVGDRRSCFDNDFMSGDSLLLDESM